MYTLSQIRRRVDALKRKYATELTVVRLYPLAEEFSLLWTRAVADGQPTPETQPFVLAIDRHQRMVERRIVTRVVPPVFPASNPWTPSTSWPFLG